MELVELAGRLAGDRIVEPVPDGMDDQPATNEDVDVLLVAEQPDLALVGQLAERFGDGFVGVRAPELGLDGDDGQVRQVVAVGSVNQLSLSPMRPSPC
jgi:hypothetical protein